MPKMAYRSENHGHPALVPGGDNLVVSYRAPWLNSGCGTRFSCRDQTVRKREESIAAYRTPLQRKAGFRSFPCGNPRGVDPRHLTGSDTQSPIFGAIDYSV